MQTPASLLQLHREVHHSIALLFNHCRQFDEQQLRREFEGFGYPSLQAQLAHIIECEDTWVARLKRPEGDELPFVWGADEPGDTVEQLETLRQRVAASTAAYIEQIGADDLNLPLTLRSPEEGPLRSEVYTPAFVLLHAITHAFHHKGQAVAICRLLGTPAPDTDIQRPQD
jgi:uncharacterized damage-inducible protein DinB